MSHIRGFIELIGRFALAAFFVVTAARQLLAWDATIQLMGAQAIPGRLEFILIGAICIQIACGISLAFGCSPRLSAIVLALYLIPVTYLFHDFWNVVDPVVQQMQMGAFLKNVAIFGGLLCFASKPPEKAAPAPKKAE